MNPEKGLEPRDQERDDEKRREGPEDEKDGLKPDQDRKEELHGKVDFESPKEVAHATKE